MKEIGKESGFLVSINTLWLKFLRSTKEVCSQYMDATFAPKKTKKGNSLDSLD